MTFGEALPETSLVLDNDTFTHWRTGRPVVQKAITAYIARLKRPPSMTTITLFEALFGVENSFAKDKITAEEAGRFKARIRQLSEESPLLPFEQTSAMISAYIYARLSQAEKNKHWRDLFVLGTALAHGHGIATQNRKDFELLAGHLPPGYFLRLATWR